MTATEATGAAITQTDPAIEITFSPGTGGLFITFAPDAETKPTHAYSLSELVIESAAESFDHAAQIAAQLRHIAGAIEGMTEGQARVIRESEGEPPENYLSNGLLPWVLGLNAPGKDDK